MDKETLEKIKLIHKNATFNSTIYSYVSAITEMFLAHPSKLLETCETLGLTEEELIDMLKSPSFSSVTLLDEIMDINISRVISKDTTLGR